MAAKMPERMEWNRRNKWKKTKRVFQKNYRKIMVRSKFQQQKSYVENYFPTKTFGSLLFTKQLPDKAHGDLLCTGDFHSSAIL